ncbi:MAG: hypothetical protein M0Z94_08375 [Dehalococcoidales bacterium]|nr:hypothetical protein [Dehalococcoidales bacterium]
MARLWHCGFETGNTLEWDLTPGQGVLTTFPNARHGTYGFVNGTVGKQLPSTYAELYARMGSKVTGSTNRTSLLFYEGATLHIEVRVGLAVDGLVTVYLGTTAIATGYIPGYVLGSWYCVEARVLINDVSSTGRVVVVIDGDYAHPIIDFTGDTRNGGTTGLIDRFYVQGSNANTQVGVVDDVAVNDTAGAIHNSWCGDGYGKLLVPNANGDLSQLVGSDANSVDNYLLVDEVPYNTTDYVESATVGAKDLYHVANPGLAANEVINSVRVVAFAKLDLPGAGSIQAGIKTAIEDWGTAVALNDTTWKVAHKFYAVDPADLAAWTEAKVNSLQVGVQVA